MKGLCRAMQTTNTRVPVVIVVTVLMFIVIIQLKLLELANVQTQRAVVGPDTVLAHKTDVAMQDLAADWAHKAEEAANAAQRAADAAQKAAEMVQHAQQSAAGKNSAAVQKAAVKTTPIPAPSEEIKPVSEGEIKALTEVLQRRLTDAKDKKLTMETLRNCSYLTSTGNVRGQCVDKDCTRQLPSSAEARVRQLVEPRHRLTKAQKSAIEVIGRDVPAKRYIFVTAASSNHYRESQGLVYNLKQYLLPKLTPGSYSFYYFDLGLKPTERQRVEKHCNCTVKTFDFKLLPSHARHLMCYAWKVAILHALLPKAEVIIYMDVSIRFQEKMNLPRFFETARQRGAQFLSNADAIPNHTVKDMFDYYGDLPCQYWPYSELLAGFSVLHNEHFIKRLVLEPWLSCALHPRCMCTVDPHAKRICAHKERLVGQCHRFDLSSMTMLMAKLFGPASRYLIMSENYPPLVQRDQTMDFFSD